MVDYRFDSPSEDEYQQAQLWYLARNQRAAAGFVRAVDRAIAIIRSFPDAFPLYDAGHRFVVVEKYPFVIFYKPGDPLVIVAVAHTSRPPGYWHGRPELPRPPAVP